MHSWHKDNLIAFISAVKLGTLPLSPLGFTYFLELAYSGHLRDCICNSFAPRMLLLGLGIQSYCSLSNSLYFSVNLQERYQTVFTSVILRGKNVRALYISMVVIYVLHIGYKSFHLLLSVLRWGTTNVLSRDSMTAIGSAMTLWVACRNVPR